MRPRWRPTFMMAMASAASIRVRISASASGPGNTVSTSLRAVSGRFSAAAQAVSEVTPGTISTGKRVPSRAKRYMNEL